MIRSMTGFGRGEAQGAGKEFVVEIKTVNHRYSDVFIKMPRQLSSFEEKIREKVGKSLSRGKVDVFVTYEDRSEDSKCVVIDEPLAKAYIKAVELLKEKYSIAEEISLSSITRFPDILRVEKPEVDEEKIAALLVAAVENALNSLVRMRENEGQELKNSLLEKALYIENIIKEIKLRGPDIVKEYKAKLENRIKELLDQQTVDESRLAMEVAIFADRCSIDEEIVRLGSHINQLRETLNISQQPIGRKLDFIVQEMNREINTIGSKSNDLEITKNVVELKSELEKIREQVQNIE